MVRIPRHLTSVVLVASVFGCAGTVESIRSSARPPLQPCPVDLPNCRDVATGSNWEVTWVSGAPADVSQIVDLAWTSDDRRVVALRADGALEIWAPEERWRRILRSDNFVSITREAAWVAGFRTNMPGVRIYRGADLEPATALPMPLGKDPIIAAGARPVVLASRDGEELRRVFALDGSSIPLPETTRELKTSRQGIDFREMRITGAGEQQCAPEPAPTSDAISPMVAPSGSVLAMASIDGQVDLWRLTDDSVERYGQVPGLPIRRGLATLEFTADSKTLYVGRPDGTLWRHQLDTNHTQQIDTGSSGGIVDVSVSFDERRIAVLSASGAIRVLSVGSRPKAPVELTGIHAKPTSIVLSRHGERIAVAEANGAIYVRSVEGDQVEAASVALPQLLHGGTLRVSSDGKLLLSTPRRGGPVLWDASNGKLVQNLVPWGDDEFSATFRPDGSAVLVTGRNSEALEFLRAGPRWESHTVAGLRGSTASYTRDADALLALSEDKVRRIDRQTGAIRRSPLPSVFFAEMIGDGSEALIGYVHDGVHYLRIDTRTLETIGQLGEGDGRHFWLPSASPDGRFGLEVEARPRVPGFHGESFSAGHDVTVWNMRSGARVSQWAVDCSETPSTALMPDGAGVAINCDRVLRFYDLHGRRFENDDVLVGDGVIRFGPAGALFVSTNNGRIYRLDRVVPRVGGAGGD